MPSLQKRRNSINIKSYEHLHCSLRSILSTFDCGADDRAIEDVLISFSGLLHFITKGNFTIVPFQAKVLPLPSRGFRPPYPNIWANKMETKKSEGYYIIMKLEGTGYSGHVISLYKCGGRWTLYDNQVEVVPLSPESSALITETGIKGINYTIGINEVQYDITYGNDTVETIKVELNEKQTEEKKFIFSGAQSYKLVRLAAVAAAGMEAAGGESRGGRRRNKTRGKRKRNNRSKRR